MTPSSGLPGATAAGDRSTSVRRRQQHDRGARPARRPSLGVGRRRPIAGAWSTRSATITANGLSARCLRRRSRRRPRRRRHRRPGEAAEPLDRHDGAPVDGGGRAAIGSAPARRASPPARKVSVGPQRGRRSAGRGSGGRRGPRTRFDRSAQIANGRHRGGRPVVGQRGHDGEPGPAVGAVDERVAVAAVDRVEQLRRGSRHRWRRRRARACAGRRRPGWPRSRSRSPGSSTMRCGVRCTRSIRASGGGVDGQPPTRRSMASRRAGDLDEDLGRVVADVTVEAELGGQGVDEGTEADPLDHPVHLDAFGGRLPDVAGRHRRARGGWLIQPPARHHPLPLSTCLRPVL